MSKMIRAFSTISAVGKKKVVVVDGVRTPFAKSLTIYNDLMSYDLARLAIKGLLTKTAIDTSCIDYVIMGTVIQEVRTSNIAREASLGAGISNKVPAHTVTMACISSNQAICTGAEKILSGQADVVIAGGSETFSDVPIRFSLPMRKKFLNLAKASKGGALSVLKLFAKGFKLSDLAPVAPAIQNFHTNEVMGHSSDRLAARFHITRDAMDRFALSSHQNAAKAHKEGVFHDDILLYNGSREDNGINAASSYEKLASLSPAFVKPHGTHTAGNSSFLTDGAAATLLMSEEKALSLGYRPKSWIKHYAFVGVDPFEELLLGPAYAISKILKETNLSLEDIDHFEIHEAFAGQVLANLKALEDEKFCTESLGRSKAIGKVDHKKLNQWGGSLAIGHPFGATGSRLVNTCSNLLVKKGGKYALIAACADSGLAHACLLEKYE